MGILVDFKFSYVWDVKEIVKYIDIEMYYYIICLLYVCVVVCF